MKWYVITLDRPRGPTSLAEARRQVGGIVREFRQRLETLVRDEGLTADLGMVEEPKNLPIVMVEASPRLARRLSELPNVRDVTQDAGVRLVAY